MVELFELKNSKEKANCNSRLNPRDWLKQFSESDVLLASILDLWLAARTMKKHRSFIGVRTSRESRSKKNDRQKLVYLFTMSLSFSDFLDWFEAALATNKRQSRVLLLRRIASIWSSEIFRLSWCFRKTTSSFAMKLFLVIFTSNVSRKRVRTSLLTEIHRGSWLFRGKRFANLESKYFFQINS